MTDEPRRPTFDQEAGSGGFATSPTTYLSVGACRKANQPYVAISTGREVRNPDGSSGWVSGNQYLVVRPADVPQLVEALHRAVRMLARGGDLWMALGAENLARREATGGVTGQPMKPDAA